MTRGSRTAISVVAGIVVLIGGWFSWSAVRQDGTFVVTVEAGGEPIEIAPEISLRFGHSGREDSVPDVVLAAKGRYETVDSAVNYVPMRGTVSLADSGRKWTLSNRGCIKEQVFTDVPEVHVLSCTIAVRSEPFEVGVPTGVASGALRFDTEYDDRGSPELALAPGPPGESSGVLLSEWPLLDASVGERNNRGPTTFRFLTPYGTVDVPIDPSRAGAGEIGPARIEVTAHRITNPPEDRAELCRLLLELGELDEPCEPWTPGIDDYEYAVTMTITTAIPHSGPTLVVVSN